MEARVRRHRYEYCATTVAILAFPRIHRAGRALDLFASHLLILNVLRCPGIRIRIR